VTRPGTSARFAAAIDPTQGGAPGEVAEVAITDHPASGYLIRVRLRDGSEEVYAYDPAGKARRVEGQETRSKLLCLRREGGGKIDVLGEAE
jgi:YD repeat-containing protein